MGSDSGFPPLPINLPSKLFTASVQFLDVLPKLCLNSQNTIKKWIPDSVILDLYDHTAYY